MKVLLVAINAKYIHSNPAVYSLAAYAGEYLNAKEKENCKIEIAEYTINHKAEAIYADIYERQPDLVGFSCYIWNWDYVREIITELSKLLPKTKIYLGGPEVSFTPDKILEEYPFLTGIMTGEGEELFLQLCKFYVSTGKEQKLPSIPGIITGEKKSEETASKLEDGCRTLLAMDRLPFLYQEMKEFANRIVYYESSRGCPYRCSYCLSSIDKKLRFRSLSKVKEELKFFLDQKVMQVKFIDRTFNCNRNHALEIWKYLLEHDNGITNFHFEVSADLIREEELQIFQKMRPGLIQLEIGVQSTREETIREIDRTMDLERLRENVAAINSYGNIHQHLDLIAGLPYEDYESFQTSFNEVYRMEPNQLQLGFLKVLKGAKMWRKAEEYGLFYTTKPPYEVLYTKWISYQEILKLKRVEEMVELYYNSDQFTYTLAMLVREFDTPFQLYERLAEYYQEKGYHINSPSRSYRYQILLDFCMQKVHEKREMYTQLLIFDLYLREKIKTRPDFAKLPAEYKEISYRIYKKEEEERSLLADYKEYNSKQLSKMTHLEIFTYSVWDKGACKLLACGYPVIFDYKRRNPLTKEAKVLQITP